MSALDTYFIFLVLISNEMTMNSNLKWPKYGRKFIFVTILEFFALGTSSSMMNVKIAMELNLSHEKLFLSILAIFINFFVAVIFLFNMLLFIMAWMEKCGQICTKYTTFNIMTHVEKCLHLFDTLQNGLGTILKKGRQIFI